MVISLEAVRRHILIALFSDDELMDALVLKGGNALALIYKVGSRASLDMDFSIRSAFDDVDRAGKRIIAALRSEFARIGFVTFDEKFEIKPTRRLVDQPEWWGGYRVEFKLALRSTFDKFGHDLEKLRRNSEVLGPLQRKTYSIDISQHEFCEGKVQREVDDYLIYVYSLEMIIAEKLRAICQQMPQYKLSRTAAPRARDFYDIYEAITSNNINMLAAENREIVAAVFSAKAVPLELLCRIGDSRDFHELDWPAVSDSISGSKMSFDFYFDFVSTVAMKLYATWVIESPLG